LTTAPSGCYVRKGTTTGRSGRPSRRRGRQRLRPSHQPKTSGGRRAAANGCRSGGPSDSGVADVAPRHVARASSRLSSPTTSRRSASTSFVPASACRQEPAGVQLNSCPRPGYGSKRTDIGLRDELPSKEPANPDPLNLHFKTKTIHRPTHHERVRDPADNKSYPENVGDPRCGGNCQEDESVEHPESNTPTSCRPSLTLTLPRSAARATRAHRYRTQAGASAE